MLIGLLAKTLLIVEFAIQRRNGMDLTKAAIEGARARLRPILMTSLASYLVYYRWLASG
jgi:HAE1 family hydrophobic/amphiphilic exporter-1